MLPVTKFICPHCEEVKPTAMAVYLPNRSEFWCQDCYDRDYHESA